MKTYGIMTAMLLLLWVSAAGQDKKAEKVKKLKFCGYKYGDTAAIRKHFGQQLDFLQIRDGDTIVDIGSSSGAYIGAINVLAEFRRVHFILVDIDSNCLNSTKVSNMIGHYEGLRGSSFNNSISFVVNSTDSLYLPLNSMRKLWMFNTLHEIPDKTDMIRQMAAVLQPGGELIIAELLATEKRKIHGGCNQPLLTEEELKQLVTGGGLTFKDMVANPLAVKKIRNPYCFYRFIKQ